MGRGIDVYQVLRSFANRNNLGEVDYRTFAQALQRQAKASDQSEPIFRDLSVNPDIVLVPRLFLLSKEGKLALQTSGNEIRSILLPERFEGAFVQEYKRMDESPDLPFPDEESLKLAVPGEWIQAIALDTDLAALSDKPQAAGRAVPLYRLTFPEGIRPIVLPAAFVPDRLLEYSVLKLRQYLRKGSNKDYMFNKLINAFPGKDSQLRDALGAVLAKPFDAVRGILLSDSDFTYPFWAYFVSAVKKDLDKKEKSAEEVSFLQAAYVCEFYVNHFKGKAQRIQDLETAIKALDAGIRKLPYNFSMEEILAFRDAKGQPVLGKFGREELEARIRVKSTKAEDGRLPELLLMAAGARRAFVAKDKALLLAARQIVEARSEIRSRLLDQWKRQLEAYSRCPAMDEDAAFCAELAAQVETRFPLLDALIRARLLPLLRDEMAERGEVPSDLARLFYKDDLVPIDELLDLSRKALLVDAKMILPFWYTMPFFSALGRFFYRLGKGREEKASARALAERKALEEAQAKESPEKAQRGLTAKERRAEFEAAASRIAKELLPPGYGLEEYLRELEGRWNTLLNPEAKRNLVYDVDSLARDYLRGVVRTMGSGSFTTERVKNLGSSLADSPTLLKIKNHQALELYLQLYMVKILGGRVEPQ